MTLFRVHSAPSLRDVLRAATAGSHAALDAALTPPGGRWTRERYTGFLRATLRVVSAAEPAIAAVLPAFVSCGEPTRAERLREDLIALGRESVAPPSPAFARVPGAAAAYGAAYVLEGSQLGGRIIAEQVSQALSLAGEGLAYLRPGPVSAGSRWRAFVAELEAFGAAVSEREWVVAATWASHTFAAFETAFRDEGLI